MEHILGHSFYKNSILVLIKMIYNMISIFPVEIAKFVVLPKLTIFLLESQLVAARLIALKT